MQRLRNPYVKQDFSIPLATGRGYLKWTEHKYRHTSAWLFAVLKLSLSMKLGYFNLKLFDKRGHWIEHKLKCQEAWLWQFL